MADRVNDFANLKDIRRVSDGRGNDEGYSSAR